MICVKRRTIIVAYCFKYYPNKLIDPQTKPSYDDKKHLFNHGNKDYNA